MKVDLSKYDNSWYQPGSKIKIVLWLVASAVFFSHNLAVFSALKCIILRMFGAKVGRGVLIKPNVSIKYPWYLEIGDHCWIGEKVWIDNLATVKIGNNSCLSQGAMLLTGNHNYKNEQFDLIIKPITIEEGVWIGAQSVVCPGVHAESHSVLTVSSVATRRMEPYTIYQGNPASPVKVRIEDKG